MSWRTNGCVGGHVVSVVEADEGQVGDVGGEDQDEERTHQAGDHRTLQTQSPGTQLTLANTNSHKELPESLTSHS